MTNQAKAVYSYAFDVADVEAVGRCSPILLGVGRLDVVVTLD
jgi:hypothetical protein